MSAYFSGLDRNGNGEREYGSAEVMKKDDLMYAAFFSRSVAYAKNPATPGGFFFDLDTFADLETNKPFDFDPSRFGQTCSPSSSSRNSSLSSPHAIAAAFLSAFSER